MDILIKKKTNEFVIPETVNFTELVKNSNKTLSLNCESKMINLLNQEFTEYESQWYITNLYIYLNYHPTNDYPINLENVYKMLGFANKGNAMKTIKSNFIKDEDYKTLFARTEKRKNTDKIRGDSNYEDDGKKAAFPNGKAGQIHKNLGGAGLNKEIVILNVDTFKNLCMIAKTDKGKEIRRYYVKLENIHNKIIKEEIENKDRLLEDKEKELEHTKKELQKMSICKIKKWYNVEPGDTVYAFKNENEPYIKIGKAENIKKREDGYTVGNRTSNIFYYKKCHSCKLTEKVLHHILDKYRLERNREWFDISDELAIYTIDMVCNFLDSFIGCSEELINLKINKQLSGCIEQANIIKENIEK